MYLERLPRKLRYRWSNSGSEIEYPANISTPVPEIKCDEVMITIPPSLPNFFQMYARVAPVSSPPNEVILNTQGQSWTVPTIETLTSGSWCYYYLWGTDAQGQNYRIGGDTFRNYYCGSAYITPGSTQQPRRDLLIGVDRIVNPTINTPCPTWRFTGGNCPPGSLDCGNCCLDCASVKSSIDGLTSAVLPFSTWRPKS